jgi:hypothetical protein
MRWQRDHYQQRFFSFPAVVMCCEVSHGILIQRNYVFIPPNKIKRPSLLPVLWYIRADKWGFSQVVLWFQTLHVTFEGHWGCSMMTLQTHVPTFSLVSMGGRAACHAHRSEDPPSSSAEIMSNKIWVSKVDPKDRIPLKLFKRLTKQTQKNQTVFMEWRIDTFKIVY